MEYEHSARMSADFGLTQAVMRSPHVRMRPKVFVDGDSWCCLYGDNLQVGVSGWGATAEAACVDFDRSWRNDQPVTAP